jgi:hypothetical protein
MSTPAVLALRPPATDDSAASPMVRRRAGLASDQRPIWEPTEMPLASSAPAVELPVTVVTAIMETILRPLRPDESHLSGNANREQELRALFASLDVPHARALQKRLDIDRADDPLARAFSRLVADRRARLRAFLADARRREALAQSISPPTTR